MDELWNQLIKKKEELESIISEVECYLKDVPEGSLRLDMKRHREQYYHRIDPKDTHGVYINRNNEFLIEKLVKKEYMLKLKKAADKELYKLKKYLSEYDPDKLINVYNQLPVNKRKWVTPYILPEDYYADLWEKQEYLPKQPPEESLSIYTERGEAVRSKSEKILADKFYFMGIPYHYEKPVYIQGYGYIYPDFHVLNKRTRKEYLWEHLGRMDHQDYVNKAIRKIESLQASGYYTGENLILTYETQQHPLNMRFVDEVIKRYLT